MAKIPPELDAIITRVCRSGDLTALPRTDTPKTKYDDVLRSALPEAQVVNITEFDYGRSFRYWIVLSKDPDAAALDDERMRRAARRRGVVEIISLAISAVAPYADMKFIRYRGNGDVEQQFSDAPLTDVEKRAAQKILDLLTSLGLQRISPALAATVLPDVRTDLCDRGEATVADCLFYG